MPDPVVVPTTMPDTTPLPPAAIFPLSEAPAPTPVGSGSGGTQVNTDALDSFNSYLGQLSDPIRNAMTKMSDVNIHPGAFYQANQLSTSINGASGLAATTQATLSRALDAITDIRSAITRLSSTYNDMDALNNADASRFQQVFGDANSTINSVLSSSNTSSSAQ